MATSDADHLQKEIDNALRTRGLSWLRIVLDKDADVLDLSTTVDVRVRIEGQPNSWDFSIRSLGGLSELLHDENLGTDGPIEDRHYCVGGPLGIVNKISGRSTVAVVFHYLCQQYGGANKLPPPSDS